MLDPVRSGFEAPRPGQVTRADPVQTGLPLLSDDVIWPVEEINRELGENIAFCNKLCVVYTVFDEEKDNFLGAEAKVAEVSHFDYTVHLDIFYLTLVFPIFTSDMLKMAEWSAVPHSAAKLRIRGKFKKGMIKYFLRLQKTFCDLNLSSLFILQLSNHITS